MAPSSEEMQGQHISSTGLGLPRSQRKRQWATKTRSGCQTCRTRRIKCDENRPVCQRCQSSRRNCSGWPEEKQAAVTTLAAAAPRSKDNAGPSTRPGRGHQALDGSYYRFSNVLMDDAMAHDSFNTMSRIIPDTRWRDADIAIHARPGLWTSSLGLAKVPLRLVPGQWQVFEAIEFFNSIVATGPGSSSLIQSKHSSACAAEPGHPSNDIIVAFALAARIVVIAEMHDSELRPSECYNTTHLWVRLYRLMETSLAKVNRDLQRPAHASNAMETKVFQRIADMMSVEYMLRVPGWQAHLEGLLSYLQLTGGPRRWMGLQVGLDNAIHKAVVYANVCNTLTPPDRMIAGLSRFSDADILHVYQATCLSGFPCPTRLFVQVRAITELRVAAASGVDVRVHAADTLERIQAFDAASWTESYELPDSPQVTLLARIFQLAVEVYCTSALKMPRAKQQGQGKRCAELMALLDEAWQDVRCEAHVGWPLAVAGFALGNIGGDDGVVINGAGAGAKTKIRGFLTALATRQHITGSGIALEKLEVFWESGKTEWDACWDEPFIETD